MTMVHHPEHGLGEIVASETTRGRTHYKVAGAGFEVWMDETEVGLRTASDQGEDLFSYAPEMQAYARAEHHIPGVPEHSPEGHGYYGDVTGSSPRDRAGDAWADGKDRGVAQHGQQDLGYQDSPQDIWNEIDRDDYHREDDAQERAHSEFGPEPTSYTSQSPGYHGASLHEAFGSSAFAHEPPGPIIEDNEVDLPYDPFDGQYPVDMFRHEQTQSPDHKLDPDKRLRPTKSRSGEPGKKRPQPGPNPDLFAKSAAHGDDGLAGLDDEMDDFIDPEEMAREEDRQRRRDFWNRAPSGRRAEGAIGDPTPHQTGPHGLGHDDLELQEYAHPDMRHDDEDFWGQGHEPLGPEHSLEHTEAYQNYQPGQPNPYDADHTAGYRPVGRRFQAAYIDAADHFNDPVQRFRDNPAGEIRRLGGIDLGYGELDPHFIEGARQFELLSKREKTAAWRDVAAKAKRLRREGHVDVQDIGHDRIYATVQGDTGVYETMIAKGGDYGQVGQGISNWRCSCKWGQWAFKRQMTYVGRLCSHAYAAYQEMQSRHIKGDESHPFNRRRKTKTGNYEDFDRGSVHHHDSIHGVDGIFDCPECSDLIGDGHGRDFSQKYQPTHDHMQRQNSRTAGVVEDFKKWIDDENGGHLDIDAADRFVATAGDSGDEDSDLPLDKEDAQKVYDYALGNVSERPERDYDQDGYSLDNEDHYKTSAKIHFDDGRQTAHMDPEEAIQFLVGQGYNHSGANSDGSHAFVKDTGEGATLHRTADLLRVQPHKLSPDLVVVPQHQGDDAHYFTDLGDDRETTGPDQIMASRWYTAKEEGHHPAFAWHTDQEQDFPDEGIVHFSAHERRAALIFTADEDLLNKLRNLSEEEPDLGNMDEQNAKKRDVIDELVDRGYDASQFVAMLRTADPDDDRRGSGSAAAGGQVSETNSVGDRGTGQTPTSGPVVTPQGWDSKGVPAAAVSGQGGQGDRGWAPPGATTPGPTSPDNAGNAMGIKSPIATGIGGAPTGAGGAPPAGPPAGGPGPTNTGPAGVDNGPHGAPGGPKNPVGPGGQPAIPGGGGAPGTYIVHPGDTLSGIAQGHGGDLGALEKGNAGAMASGTNIGQNPDLIHPGDVLNLPGGAGGGSPAAGGPPPGQVSGIGPAGTPMKAPMGGGDGPHGTPGTQMNPVSAQPGPSVAPGNPQPAGAPGVSSNTSPGLTPPAAPAGPKPTARRHSAADAVPVQQPGAAPAAPAPQAVQPVAAPVANAAAGEQSAAAAMKTAPVAPPAGAAPGIHAQRFAMEYFGADDDAGAPDSSDSKQSMPAAPPPTGKGTDYKPMAPSPSGNAAGGAPGPTTTPQAPSAEMPNGAGTPSGSAPAVGPSGHWSQGAPGQGPVHDDQAGVKQVSQQAGSQMGAGGGNPTGGGGMPGSGGGGMGNVMSEIGNGAGALSGMLGEIPGIGSALSGIGSGIGSALSGLGGMFHGSTDAERFAARYFQADGSFLGEGGHDQADYPFAGSGPDRQDWSTTSQDYIDEHEKGNRDETWHTDNDGDITTYTSPRQRPKQAAVFDDDDRLSASAREFWADAFNPGEQGYFNPNNRPYQEDDSDQYGPGDKPEGKGGHDEDGGDSGGGQGMFGDALEGGGTAEELAPLLVGASRSDDDNDIVRQFQASEGAAALMKGGSKGGGAGRFDDFAGAAERFLKTAGRVYSPDEQRALEEESHPGGARNLGSLQLEGTHYE